MHSVLSTAVDLGLRVKNLPANVGDVRDTGSISGLRRSPGGGHGNPLQYSCLENPMDGGTWRATVHGVAKSRIWLSNFTSLHPLQYSWASLVAQMVKNPPALQETWVWSPDWEDSLEEGMANHSSFLAWRIPMDRGAWRAIVHRVAKRHNWATKHTACASSLMH